MQEPPEQLWNALLGLWMLIPDEALFPKVSYAIPALLYYTVTLEAVLKNNEDLFLYTYPLYLVSSSIK